MKGQVYAGGVLEVLLYGCESWCLAAASLNKLCLWHNKRFCEMCRVIMCKTVVCRITSKRTKTRQLRLSQGTPEDSFNCRFSAVGARDVDVLSLG